ncbi:ABC transporter ATP-binding protein, partial [Enterococcus faecium]|nr:ABC transporter ATP-binding protein [Enterococcus faecium]
EKREKTKLTYMEQKEWATIEEDITQLETKLETLTEEMNHQGDDFVRLQELQEAVTATEQLLEEKMNRWEYLSEYAD